MLLTIVQRLSLENIIRQQRGGAGEDFLVLVDLWKKLALRDDEKVGLIEPACIHCGAQSRYSAKALLLEPIEVNLERAESRRLVSLLDGWRQFTVDDHAWLSSLREQLKESR